MNICKNSASIMVQSSASCSRFWDTVGCFAYLFVAKRPTVPTRPSFTT
jgi:hypothetical protein